jgi:hypothetical protein
MSVKRPRNINDVDLTDYGVNIDLPIAHPTEMSYFLQRIRVAEIARRIVDHQQDNSREGSDSCSSRSYARVMTIDAEFEQLIHELPPFLHFDKLKETDDTTGAGIFIQAYFFNSNLNIHRCKLHLGYLASKSSESLAYTYSRDACLGAARRLVRGEMQLERSQHVFARMRLRLTGILFGVFMAGIVLLMDACVNGSEAVQDEIRSGEGGEAAEALRIIEDARSQSVAAANLYQSLMQMLAMFRAQKEQQQQQQQQQQQRQQQDAELHAAGTSVTNASVYQPDPGSQTPMSHPVAPIGARIAWNGEPAPGHMQESGLDSQHSLNHSQLFRTIEEMTSFDGFQWDDLFSEIDASSLF